ncbi:phosphoribosylglycinamide formyltransferase [Mesobacillus harenae]|uniref:phosphoribosylglycinamide formyltransferase n=1 Tax=Mesobacillus harenae TaxID=2213203 RepID=UPI00157FEC55|nr:phosphoribosylglycinamide formyltransferase [Mesobacillus harenae]
MKKIAVFASGNGSNFQAIADAVRQGRLKAQISLLVCDKPQAYVLERALQAEIPSFVFNAKDYSSKIHYEAEVLAQLRKRGIEFIVLAGYMRLVGETLLKAYDGKIVNIHPSVLPNFPGKDAIGQALAAKAEETGVTVHFVDEGMDTGPIIASEVVEISSGETRESLQNKLQQIEHDLYPAVLQELLAGNKEELL